MPRKVIPIRTGPAQFDFQDSAGGLTDGLAQAIATLAALPMQNRQIEQDYALRTAEVNRQNRRDDEHRRDRTLSDAFRTGAAPAEYAQDPQFQGAVQEYERKVQDDNLANALRQHQADLQMAQAGGYAGPDRALGQIAANVGEDQQARRDMREQGQAARLAHGVAENDRRWNSADLARIMGVEHTGSSTGTVPSPINPDLVNVGRNGIKIEQPKGQTAQRDGWQVMKGDDGKFYRFNRASGAMEEIEPKGVIPPSDAEATSAPAAPTFPTPESPSQSAFSLRTSGAPGGPQTLGDVLGGRWFGAGDQPAAATQQDDPQTRAAGSLRAVSEAAGKANITPEQRQKFMATQSDLHQRYLAAAAAGNQQEMARINAAIVKHAQLVTAAPSP